VDYREALTLTRKERLNDIIPLFLPSSWPPQKSPKRIGP